MEGALHEMLKDRVGPSRVRIIWCGLRLTVPGWLALQPVGNA
uniref:Uncharacterized protein n=1 Tax=Physcomitrium patens TaxID=3218 RepID=A0A2K1LA00_PHYPA|nr:hypothetical protein PHYPA_001283 [Physcomitrium patens]